MSEVTPFDGPQPVLRDSAVSLRPLRSGDEDLVMLASQDPQTARWTTIPAPYAREHATFFVHEHGPAAWNGASGAVWAMCRPGSDDFAGAMELRILPEDRAVGDVGFACAPWARGEGLTTAGLRLCCRWGFEALGLARIEWRAYAGNAASRRVAEKAGFRFEGCQRSRLLQRGERRDAWIAALLPGDLRP